MAQMLALGFLIIGSFGPAQIDCELIGEVLLWIAGILTVWTGYDYYRGAWPHVVEDTP
jgi:cardiolipin synthase